MTDYTRRTNKKHFEVFKAECRRLERLWGIDDLGIHFHHGKRTNSRATFLGKHTARIATVVLSTEWETWDAENPPEPITDDEVRATARHEMIHALLLPLGALPGSYCTEDEATEAEERIVQKLTRLLPDRSRKR